MTKKKVSFRDQLAIKLKDIGQVEVDKFSDGSASWVNLRIDSDKILEISFDGKGEKITSIAFFQEVREVVDHKKVWSTNE